jgi:DNA modification methylase
VKTTLLLGDSLERLRELDANSVDAVVTDPPYGIDFQSAWRTDRTKHKPKIANDKMPFIWWLPQAFRVLREGGGMLCFCRWDVQEDFRRAIEIAGFQVKSQVIWDREVHGMGDLKASFGPQHDVIWFATKGKFEFPGSRPKSIVRSQRLSGDQLVHPNEKPVDLLEQLVSSITREGEAVLDCFMGSGSTGIACVNTKRKFVGIELDAGYFEIARRRITHASSADESESA